MKFFIPIMMALFLAACTQSTPAPETAAVDPTKTPANEMIYKAIPGSDVQQVTIKNNQGKIKEEGFMLNGVRTGMWLVYDKSQVFPKKMISYQNDMYNGPYFEYTERGQMDLKANYVNNKLDGYFAKYKFSNEIVTANYSNGKRNGEYKEFDERESFLTKLENYKDDVLDGKVEYYNKDGEIIMSYEYKNGEKVSGGMINPK
ncbi:MAG: hypothetical protein KDC85_07025 [Saprospiraceae bacterium]|nr:hypothetical protein [Saprospiraceae bacterium]MCB9323722.1 hypothetical protein [Lewinellaceae bacterium]